jgi:hypothetical protein
LVHLFDSRTCPAAGASCCFESQASAEPWTIEFGNCTFYGDTAGAPLVREGSCPSEGDTLDLSSKGITALEVNAFKGMTQLR